MTGQPAVLPPGDDSYETLPLPNLYALNQSSQDYDTLPIPDLIALGGSSQSSAATSVANSASFSTPTSVASSASSSGLGTLPIPGLGSASSATSNSVSSSGSTLSSANSSVSSTTVIAGGGGGGGGGGRRGGAGGTGEAGPVSATRNTGRQSVAGQPSQSINVSGVSGTTGGSGNGSVGGDSNLPTNPFSPANQVAGVHQADSLQTNIQAQNDVLGASLIQQQAQAAAQRSSDLPDAGPIATGVICFIAFSFFIFLFRRSATALRAPSGQAVA